MSVRKGSKIIAGAYAVIKPDVYVKTEVDDLLDKKQDKLIAGTNIFIGDDNVISATGGGGGYINVVQETGDSTDDVMSQASVTHELEQKVNTLDLADIAFTSDYNDLSNTPDLATYTKTEDLAEVALTGDYDDLGNTPDLTLYAKTEDLSKVAVSNNYEDLDDKPNLNVYDTVVSVNNKLSFKQDNLKAGYGISIEDGIISNTVDTIGWGKIIGDISTQEDLQGEFTAIRDNSLNKTQITNCLLEVPQRIKLELNEGTLTLKAGSQVIVPNGFEDDGVTPRFDYVDIENDLEILAPTNTSGIGKQYMTCFVTDSEGNIGIERVYNWESGDGSSYTNNWEIYYNTVTNRAYTVDGGVDKGNTLSLPIALIITDTVGVWKSIDQTFNGLGYIGSTVWVDKGVKGLIPNGRNEDGTLNNIEFTTDKILMQTQPNATANIDLYLSKTEVFRSTLIYYNEKLNLNISSNDGTNASAVLIGSCTLISGAISNFQHKLPFRAVDWSDIKKSINVGEIGKPQISLDSNLPSGCVWLEGSTVSRTTYANLFAIYGTTYGAGDGSTTFVLPDFRNRAIWGSDGFGYLSAGLPNITGSVDAGNGSSGQGNGCGNLRTGSGSGVFTVSNDGFWNNNAQVYNSGYSKTLTFNASKNNSIYGKSSTVQPPAIKVRVYTRYQ